ncbi:MAG TPA: sigma 54-interacting transcriptional regulator [Kofleriaceae bacterium]|nr:sigma 54-interacting transcriptional regulator [Kofleriaceae bacterium]
MTTRQLSTRIVEAGAARLEVDAATLKVIRGPDRGLEVALGPDSMRIGTAADCELVLHDPTVSTRHAEIAITRRGLIIRDLGSKNGVVLGTVAVHRAPLFDRAKIHLGETTLVIRALGRRHSVPLSRAGRFGGLVATSVGMRAVVATLERFATAEVTVLIEGETGTGKEVAARALHDAGPRAAGPFIVLDCGALPPSLIAPELFGHERGAFTGAVHTRPGLLEQADGGTLFVDEIGELSLDLQPVLLRALETHKTRRVGGRKELVHDVRVIAATNRNLAEEVRAGRFREDLFFRLAVARVRLPPLRERPGDIPVLAGLFAAEVGFTMPPELGAALESHDWPGNVRELRNAICAAAAGGGLALAPFSGRDLFRDGDRIRPLPEARQLSSDDFERRYLEQVLDAAGGNLSRAADLAGVSRQLLTRLAKKHHLRDADRRGGD